MGLMVKVKSFFDEDNQDVTTRDFRLSWLNSSTRRILIERGFDHVFVGVQLAGESFPDYFVYRIRHEDHVLLKLALPSLELMRDEAYYDVRNACHRMFFQSMFGEFGNLDDAVGIREYIGGTYFNTMTVDQYKASLWPS